MSVRIRLSRVGATGQPSYRVVATDRRSPRDGRSLEILGHYNPRTKPAVVQVDKDRVAHWMGKGAQPSDSVRTLIARHLTPAPAEAVTIKVSMANDASSVWFAVMFVNAWLVTAPTEEPSTSTLTT